MRIFNKVIEFIFGDINLSEETPSKSFCNTREEVFGCNEGDCTGCCKNNPYKPDKEVHELERWWRGEE